VVSVPRHKDNNLAQFDGLELRAPNADSSYRNPDGNGAAVFSDGPPLPADTRWRRPELDYACRHVVDIASQTAS
jgi:hypothetical protein